MEVNVYVQDYGLCKFMDKNVTNNVVNKIVNDASNVDLAVCIINIFSMHFSIEFLNALYSKISKSVFKCICAACLHELLFYKTNFE